LLAKKHRHAVAKQEQGGNAAQNLRSIPLRTTAICRMSGGRIVFIWLYHGSGTTPSIQDAAHGGSSDVQAAGDLSFADARAGEFPYLDGVEGRREWPAQTLAVLAGVGQAGPNSFPQNLPFELRVLQLFAKCRLCGGRDYAKPQRRSSGAACVSSIWDSA
jgi:hypothetical protein